MACCLGIILLAWTGHPQSPQDPGSSDPATLPPVAEASAETDEGIRRRIAEANSRFGIRLLQQSICQRPNTNSVLSPTSIASLLTLLANGTAGETRRSILEALELHDLDLQVANHGHQALGAARNRRDAGIRWELEQSVWSSFDLDYRPRFLEIARQAYQADVFIIDFSEGATDLMDTWVHGRTDGRIETMNGSFDLDTVLVLLSAAIFEGAWQQAFDPEQTSIEPFSLPGNRPITLPTMQQLGEYHHLEADRFEILYLPYQGGRVGMYILLPDEEYQLDEMLGELTYESWERWTTDLHDSESKEGLITLPRFRINVTDDLRSALSALGMGVAFDARRADFSNLFQSSNRAIFLKQIQHKVVLEVDEKGTRSAMATEIEAGYEGAYDFFRFHVDRPFVFVIRDEITRDLLLIGAVFDPSGG